MKVILHPYKGYLNTKFHIFAEGGTQKYTIYPKGSETGEGVLTGLVEANKPHSFKLSQPGKFTVVFEDGTTTDFFIEDAYKFGGGKFKKSYIFDESSWAIIIMHDRTYFSNRATGEEYVEAISPDEIIEVSDDFILMKNENQDEITLYSLIEQKPVVWLSNLIFQNDRSIVWREDVDSVNKTRIIIFSLADLTKKHILETTSYIVDDKNQWILVVNENTVEKIILGEEFEKKTIGKFEGDFATFISPSIVASTCYKYGENHIYLTDFYQGKILKDIKVEGEIAEINDVKLVNTNDHIKAIKSLELDELGIPNAIVSVTFVKFKFFPCEWDVFYTKTTETVLKDCHKFQCRQNESHLMSINTSEDIELYSAYGDVVTAPGYFLYYENNKAHLYGKGWVRFRDAETGEIFKLDNQIFLIKDDIISRLNKNGYWDKCCTESEYDTTYLKEYGILLPKKGLKSRSIISHWNYGPFERRIYSKYEGLRFKSYVLLKENLKCLTVPEYESMRSCEALSPKMCWGIKKTTDGFAIVHLLKEHIEEADILTDLYDPSKYLNVLFSEDGEQIMFRDSEQTNVLDMASGETKSYPVWSYVKHINGIRPLFRRAGSLQPVLVNPVTGQVIDHQEMRESQFVSPDGKLYADGNLSEYIEYRFADSQEVISKEEYRNYLRSYSFCMVEKDSPKWEIIRAKRKQMVLDHFEYLNKQFPDIFKKDRSGENWPKWLLEGKSDLNVKNFLDLMIICHGKAIIRKVEDNSVYAEVDLGDPLTFMNYVSFSHDSRYMALAGYRDCGGGLFLLYDLIERRIVINSKQWNAVWTTAFSKDGAVAAYTSRPITFIARNEEEYEWDDKSGNEIKGRNFLTFSPDGKFFALSKQGYISKFDKDGNERFGWGHQSSSVVEIRSTDNFAKPIISYNDLSDSGIADSPVRAGVASVSFSKDNRKIMMVGKDGVVIIRNLHLEGNAGE